MELHDVMRTTFAAREFTDDPVDDATLYRILDNARFAPSGGNRQGWRVIVIRDQAKRAALVDLIRPTMQRYFAQAAAGENPFNTIVPTKVDAAQVAAAKVPSGMIEGMVDAPVLLLVASTCASSLRSIRRYRGSASSPARRSIRSSGTFCSPHETKGSAARSPRSSRRPRPR